MTQKVVVCISCPQTSGTDANGNTVTLWQEWDTETDLEEIYQHQVENPDHTMIKGYKG